jgi:hypothetical protein
VHFHQLAVANLGLLIAACKQPNVVIHKAYINGSCSSKAVVLRAFLYTQQATASPGRVLQLLSCSFFPQCMQSHK